MLSDPPSTNEGDVNLSGRRGAWQSANLDDATRLLLAEDAEVFLHQSLSTPCLNGIAKAEGAWIEDLGGRRYLDFHGNSVHQLGHGHPAIVRAIKDQLDALPFSPRRYTNGPAVQLARRLGEIAPPGLTKVLFAPSGTAALGIALKLARVATGRFKTVSMWDSFHGASLDSISVGGEEQFRRGIGPLLAGTEHVPPPDPRRCPLTCGPRCSLACAKYLEYVLDHEGDVAAVIAEPLRSTTAVAPPAGYWPAVRAACDRHGALLIFDEIPSGLGRVGHLFATELTGVVPDVVVLGKGLGGGIFPLAAVVARADLDVAGDVSLGHYTHEKSPVGAAAALATLDILQSAGFLEETRRRSARFAAELHAMASIHPAVLEVRATGFLMGVEMTGPRVAEETMYQALDRGLSFKVSAGTVLTLTPPLTITEDELEFALHALDGAIGAAEQHESS